MPPDFGQKLLRRIIAGLQQESTGDERTIAAIDVLDGGSTGVFVGYSRSPDEQLSGDDDNPVSAEVQPTDSLFFKPLEGVLRQVRGHQERMESQPLRRASDLECGRIERLGRRKGFGFCGEAIFLLLPLHVDHGIDFEGFPASRTAVVLFFHRDGHRRKATAKLPKPLQQVGIGRMFPGIGHFRV